MVSSGFNWFPVMAEALMVTFYLRLRRNGWLPTETVTWMVNFYLWLRKKC